MKFKSPYDAGYDAGLNGANADNCHFGWFNKPENTNEWERGNNAGRNKKKEIEHKKKLKK